MGRFTLPRDLYYGKDSLENLKNIDGKKAIVVSGGSSMRRGGFLDKVEAYLKEAGMEVQLFEGVEPDQSAEVHRLTRLRPCGHSMNILRLLLSNSVHLSHSRNFAKRLNL